MIMKLAGDRESKNARLVREFSWLIGVVEERFVLGAFRHRR